MLTEVFLPPCTFAENVLYWAFLEGSSVPLTRVKQSEIDSEDSKEAEECAITLKTLKCYLAGLHLFLNMVP